MDWSFPTPGVNLLIGTDSGLMLLDRSGEGKVYPLISRKRFEQMDVLESQNILVCISGECHVHRGGFKKTCIEKFPMWAVHVGYSNMGLTMLGIPIWAIRAGYSIMGLHAGKSIMGCTCWILHYGVNMLDIPTWAKHAGYSNMG